VVPEAARSSRPTGLSFVESGELISISDLSPCSHSLEHLFTQPLRLKSIHLSSEATKEVTMPVLLIPLLVGVPVVLAGGYWIIHSMH
jgi:hypothetical protein